MSTGLARPSTLVSNREYREALYKVIEQQMDCDRIPVTSKTAGDALQIAEATLTDLASECGCVVLQRAAGRFTSTTEYLREMARVYDHTMRQARYFWEDVDKQNKKAAHESGNIKKPTATVPHANIAAQGGVL